MKATIITIICLSLLGLLIYPATVKCRPSYQAWSRNNLKQAGANLTAYMGDLTEKQKRLTFPPLGKANKNSTIVTTLDTALEGLPTHCPFYKLPYAYSKIKVGDTIIDEGQPVSNEILKKGIDIIIIQGAKDADQEGAPKYAPIKAPSLRGDFSVGDHN